MNWGTDTQGRYAIAAQEDRCAPRHHLPISVGLRPAGARALRTTLKDISTAGFSALSVSRLHPGTLVWLSLPGLEPLRARVEWWNASLVGCAFAEVLSPIVLQALLARQNGESQPRLS